MRRRFVMIENVRPAIEPTPRVVPIAFWYLGAVALIGAMVLIAGM